MKFKCWEKTFQSITNADSIEQYVIEIKSGIMINDNVSGKSIVCAKKYIVAILACENIRYLKVLLMIQQMCGIKL